MYFFAANSDFETSPCELFFFFKLKSKYNLSTDFILYYISLWPYFTLRHFMQHLLLIEWQVIYGRMSMKDGLIYLFIDIIYNGCDHDTII